MTVDRDLARPDDEAFATPDRIRDATVEVFGRYGFGVGVPSIAAEAGVTAGLVVHHFGSKNGLRRAVALLDLMIADADSYLAAGVAAGVVRPSRDAVGWARHLTFHTVVGIVLFSRHPPASNPVEFRHQFRRYVQEVTAPALQLFTQGLLVDRSMLDDYLMYVPDPPSRG